MKKDYLNELYIFRALAIIAVLLIHGTSTATANLKDSSYYFLYVLANKMSVYAVPSFIFLSGLVLFYSYYDRPYSWKMIGTFYKKRILYIVVPMIVFSIFYELFYLYWYILKPNGTGLIWYVHEWRYVVSHFFKRLFIDGGTFYHMYFMFVIVQFYLLFPVFLLLSKSKYSIRFLILIGFILQWCFIFLNREYGWLPKPQIYWMNYIGYFLFGAWVALYYSKVKSWYFQRTAIFIPICIIWLGLGIYYSLISYQTLMGIASPPIFPYLTFAYAIVSCVVLLWISDRLYQYGTRVSTNALIYIGAYSFGIYFIHPLFQIFIRNITGTPNHAPLFHIYVWSTIILILVVSFIVCYVIRKYFKYYWVLFGKIPHQLPISKRRIS